MKIKILLLLSFVIISCQISLGDKSVFVRNYDKKKPIKSKKAGILWNEEIVNANGDFSAHDHSSVSENSFYLDDIYIKKINLKGMIYGEKIPFSKMKFSNKNGDTPFKIAEEQLKDLLDDYILNDSTRNDNLNKIYEYKVNNSLRVNLSDSEIKRFINKKIVIGDFFSFFKNKPIVQIASFNDLGGCNDDNLSHFMISFLQSCKVIERNKYRKNISTSSLFLGSRDHWLVICDEVKLLMSNLTNKDELLANEYIAKFIKDNFVPLKISNSEKKSRFTGYYAFNIDVSAKKTSKYKYPIYGKPNECRSSLTCYDRKQIDIDRKIDSKYIKLWAKNSVDIYKLHLQGSGVGVLENDSVVYIYNTGSNYHEYTSFYDVFLTKKSKYPQLYGKNYSQILDWMSEDGNQDEAVKILSYNPSYMFFDYSYKNNIRGAEGSVLTPARSLAIDRTVIPYGTPICLKTKIPVIGVSTGKYVDFDRMVVAQDTGAAIKGYVRADVFFGYEKKSAILSNSMDFEGSWFILVPKIVFKE